MDVPLTTLTKTTRACATSMDVVQPVVDDSEKARGAIYTKPEVVCFMLELCGYKASAPLTDYRLLEPSCGDGAILLPAIDRLLTAAKREGALSYERLAPAIKAVELHGATFRRLRKRVASRLRLSALSEVDVIRLCDEWLTNGDFLLQDLPNGFTHVVRCP